MRINREEIANAESGEPPAAPKKPAWQEVFAALDAAKFPDDFLEDRYAGISLNPERRDNN